MEAKDYAAWTGAVTGVLSLCWNFYSKSVEGPRIQVKAYGGMVTVPKSPNDPKILKVVVRNVGTRKTTITNCALHSDYKFSWRHRRRLPETNAVMHTYTGPLLPHKLDSGEECEFLMSQDASFDEWLNRTDVWFSVIHSFAPIHGTIVKIFNPKSKTC